MGNEFGKRLNAFFDGINVGLDILGVARGRLTDFKDDTGYLADLYGYKRSDNGTKKFEGRIPINRSLEEQAYKGVGTSIGLLANVLTLGIPQLYELIKRKQTLSNTEIHPNAELIGEVTIRL